MSESMTIRLEMCPDCEPYVQRTSVDYTIVFHEDAQKDTELHLTLDQLDQLGKRIQEVIYLNTTRKRPCQIGGRDKRQ